MFDFRYHALSLVAVFLALGIGIVLGVTIGDSLVSEAEKGVRSSLRDDVIEAREQARRARGDLSTRERLIEAAFPALAAGRLRGERVALLAAGSLPDGVESSVREAVKAAGGSLDSVSLVESGRPKDLGRAVGGRFRRLGSREPRLAALGRRVGRAVARGARLARRLRRVFPERFRGAYRGVDAVAFYREPPDEDASKRERRVREVLDEGLIVGLRRAGTVVVVGVEEAETDPSQVPYFEDRGLPSVDSVDLAGGRVALVLALAGAQGAFGFKKSADEPLPRVE